MSKKAELTPILKWVGGKRQSLDIILPLIPKKYSTYYEPFVGGGAVFFSLQPRKAVINDINDELMNVYQVIRSDAQGLLEKLAEAAENHSEDFYYKVRERDRNQDIYNRLSAIDKAARTIYLNKTCYNGLYRVNTDGKFNTPYGKYKNPNIINRDTILNLHAYLNKANVQIRCDDYRRVLSTARCGAFVYFDPPYMPISETANFTSYTADGFDIEQQVMLKQTCDDLTRRGIKFLLSNANTWIIRQLYRKYKIKIIKAKRAINSVADKRGAVEEVLVKNYE